MTRKLLKGKKTTPAAESSDDPKGNEAAKGGKASEGKKKKKVTKKKGVKSENEDDDWKLDDQPEEPPEPKQAIESPPFPDRGWSSVASSGPPPPPPPLPRESARVDPYGYTIDVPGSIPVRGPMDPGSMSEGRSPSYYQPPPVPRPILKSADGGRMEPDGTRDNYSYREMSERRPEYRRVSRGSKLSKHSVGSTPGAASQKEAQDASLGPAPPGKVTNKLLQMFSSVDHVWLEHSKNHTGSQPPNPYEYDVYAGVQQRILYIMPLYHKDTPNVEVKRGLGFASTSYVIPPEFSCLTPVGEDICHITWEVIQKWCSKSPRIKMDVLVMGMPLGKVTQKRRDIFIEDVTGKEVITIKDVPMPSRWVCTASSRPFTCKILKAEQARDPSIIGVIGRNGPDTKAVIFGQPLGFYFHLKGTGKENRKKTKLDEASRVCLLSVLVGLMTTYVNRKQ